MQYMVKRADFTLQHPVLDFLFIFFNQESVSVFLYLYLFLCVGIRAHSNQWDKSQSIRCGRLNREYTPCWIQTRASERAVVYMAYGRSWRVNTNQEEPSIILDTSPKKQRPEHTTGIRGILIMVNVQKFRLQCWTNQQPRHKDKQILYFRHF